MKTPRNQHDSRQHLDAAHQNEVEYPADIVRSRYHRPAISAPTSAPHALTPAERKMGAALINDA